MLNATLNDYCNRKETYTANMYQYSGTPFTPSTHVCSQIRDLMATAHSQQRHDSCSLLAVCSIIHIYNPLTTCKSKGLLMKSAQHTNLTNQIH